MHDIEVTEEIHQKLVWFLDNYSKTKSTADVMRVTGVEFNESLKFSETFDSKPLVLNNASVTKFTKELKSVVERYQELLQKEQEYKRNKKWKLKLLVVLSQIFKMRGENYLT